MHIFEILKQTHGAWKSRLHIGDHFHPPLIYTHHISREEDAE